MSLGKGVDLGVLREGILQNFLQGNCPPSAFVRRPFDEVFLAEESAYHHRQLKRLGMGFKWMCLSTMLRLEGLRRMMWLLGLYIWLLGVRLKGKVQ